MKKDFWKSCNGQKDLPGGQKKVYLEILRVIAIFGVLFCHSGSFGIHHYAEAQNRANYWLGIFFASVAQYCIPLFFMITGALLLKKEESVGFVFRHRVLKMEIVTCLAVLLQYYWNYKENPLIGFDRKTYFRILFEGGAVTPQWFLYAYLSFLFVLPFLQRFVRVLTDQSLFLYLFLGYEVINDLFRVLAYYQEWGTSLLGFPMFPDIIVYSIMGYYLESASGDTFYEKKNILIMAAISILLTAEAMHLNHLSFLEGELVEFGDLFVMAYAMVIFVVVRRICSCRRIPAILEKILCFAGGGVFGTYLIESRLMELSHPLYLALNTKIYSYPAIFVQITICIIIGILIANLCKRIPVIGKLL